MMQFPVNGDKCDSHYHRWLLMIQLLDGDDDDGDILEMCEMCSNQGK